MNKTFYIIGCGPTGLVTGYELLKKGQKVVFFDSNNMIGGMCRSWKEEDYILDTGPHIYHTPEKELAEYWIEEFGDLLIEGEFWSKNVKDGDIKNLIDYPLSWESISKFDEGVKSKILKELEKCQNSANSEAKTFSEYVNNLVGPTLTEMFFTKYPKKVWGKSTSELTADWAPKRIEIREKITPFYHKQFAAVGRFGTGCIYDDLYKKILKLGGLFQLKEPIIGLDYNINRITKLISKKKTYNLTNDSEVISTIPINILGQFLGAKSELKFRGITSVYIGVNKSEINWPEKINWLYFDSDKYSFNRITNSSSLSPEVCPKHKDLITIETTYSKGDELDLLDKKFLEEKILSEVIDSKIISEKDNIDFISSNKEAYVYPIQHPNYQVDLANLKSKINKYNNLNSIGTGGDFNYADSQVIFHKSYDLVDDLLDSKKEINQTFKIKKRINFNENVIIGDTVVGDGNHPSIIAEIGLNHNGSLKTAKKMIDELVSIGIKFAKIQTYTSGNSRVSDKVKSANYVEKITDQEETLSGLLERCKLGFEDQIELFSYAKNKSLLLFSTPFDIASADFLNNEIGVPCFKIASVDLVNLPLISHVASFNKPIILSCGMSGLSDIEDALNCISNQGNPNVILLHCNSSYPAPLEKMNLNVIKTLKESFKLPVGLSDHTFGPLASTIAMSIGANIVERHFTLDKYYEGPDHILSSEPDEMKEISNFSNKILTILGNGIKSVEESEYDNISSQRKGVYALKDIKPNEIFTTENTCIKGPSGAILPKYLDIILGRKATSFIENDTPITWEKI